MILRPGKYNPVILSILVFLLLRLIVIFFFIDSIYCPENELYLGFISSKLTSLHLFSLFEYTTSPREISEVLFIYPLSFFIAIFGSNYAAIKIFSLFLSTLNVLVWYSVLKRVSSQSALFFIWLNIASSFLVTNVSLTLWPGEFYASLFIGTIFLLAIRIAETKKSYLYFLLGIAAGAGSWFYYVPVLFFPFVVPFLIIESRRSNTNIKSVLLLIAGFLLGVASWLDYNYSHSFASLFIHGDNAAKLTLWHFLTNLKKIFVLFLPNIFSYRLKFLHMEYIFIIVLAYAFIKETIVVLKQYKRGIPDFIKAVILGYSALYVVLLSLSAVQIKCRYLFPLIPLFLSIISFLARDIRSSKVRIYLTSGLFIIYAVSFWQRAYYFGFLNGFRYKADDTYGYFGHILSSEKVPAGKLSTVLKLPYINHPEFILQSYLENEYASSDINFRKIHLLIDKFRSNKKMLSVFYNSFQKCDIDKGYGDSFCKRVNNIVKICGMLEHSNANISCIPKKFSSLAEDINSLFKNSHMKKSVYRYLGRLTYEFKKRNFYDFYRDIPAKYQYDFVKGYIYEEVDNIDDSFFFRSYRSNYEDNYLFFRKCINEKLNMLPLDAAYEKYVISAYATMFYVYCSLSMEDDYMIIPFSAKNIKEFLRIRGDRDIIFYTRRGVREELRLLQGIFDDDKIRSSDVYE